MNVQDFNLTRDKMFHAFLRMDFEKIPGEIEVRSGNYLIFDHSGQVIGRSHWPDFSVSKTNFLWP